jgi:hypothetical protein
MVAAASRPVPSLARAGDRHHPPLSTAGFAQREAGTMQQIAAGMAPAVQTTLQALLTEAARRRQMGEYLCAQVASRVGGVCGGRARLGRTMARFRRNLRAM